MTEGPQPVAGSKENFKMLLDAGMPPDKLVLASLHAIRNTVSDLMHAVPKEQVSESARLQVMSLAMVIDNACSALEAENVILPEEIEKGLQALGTALEELVNERREGRTRAGGEGAPNESEEPDGSPEVK